MIALIIGINGFVGQHLEKVFLRNNHKVYGAAYNYEGKRDYIECDIRDYSKLEGIITKIKPDVIIDLAALSTLKACEENPKLARDIMVVGFENILNIIQKNGLSAKVLFTSSSQVYGKAHNRKISEAFDASPISLYGKLKLEAEKISEKYAVNVIITRSFNHIGPGQEKGFITSDFASKIVKIEKEGMKGEITVKSMKTVRDYTDVRDIAKAYYLLIMKADSGIYNVCRSKGYTGSKLLDIMMKNTKAGIKITEKEEDCAANISNIKCLIGDNSKIRKLGWQPKIIMEKSLKDILNYWRKEIKS
jgi:GDP-4-dehydro-6-deoxy-D-mannose reductase